MLERIQKIIAAAGVTSRRAAEELIAEGRVRVNGKVVTELGTKADADKDHIKVDGKLINPQQPKVYVMLNKPAGFVTTMSDPEGRPTVQDLLKGVKVRVYPVGRLDYNTEGMLILTNDGDFAHLITHPKHEFPKTYLAKVKGVLDDSQIDSLEQGIHLDDGKTAPAKLKKIRKEEANSWVEITIHEGRKRQVRRMFDRVGRSVIKLKRIRTGNLVLGNLPEGAFRYLTPAEVNGLRELSQKTEVSGQESGVRSQKAEERPQRTVATRGDERRPMSAKGPKKAHRGAKPDARPWKEAERKIDDRREIWPGGRNERFGTRTMQDTRGGLRRNQGVKASAPQQRRPLERPVVSASSRPQGDSTYSPASRPATSRTTMRTGIGRPATGPAMGKPEVRRKPDQRPWPGTRKSGPSRNAPGAVTGFGPRKDSTARLAARSTMSRPITSARAGAGRPATGAFSGRPETRKKPAPRSWPDSGKSDSRSKGTWQKSREEGRKPGSGPRPNRSSRPAGKGPGRGARPGFRSTGQGASNRGPRR